MSEQTLFQNMIFHKFLPVKTVLQLGFLVKGILRKAGKVMHNLIMYQ